MRLALLSPLPPEQSGLADYAAHFRASLNQAGVDVLTPLAGQRPLDSLSAARAWVAERDWRRVDVVHAELGPGRRSEFLILLAMAGLPSRPALSATVHEPDRLIWEPVNALWGAVKGSALPAPVKSAMALLSDPAALIAERRLARQLDGLVAMTQTGAGRLVKTLKVAPDQVSVIPHGAMALPHKPLPDADPIRLLYFGFIHAGKGIEDLIDAVARVRAQQPPEQPIGLRLTIAGGIAPDGGLHAREHYLGQLRARVERRGLTPMVGWELDVDERDIPDLAHRHHLLVQPHREAAGLSPFGHRLGTSAALTWAISCGRGAITTDARAFAEEVSHGNGAAYRQGDVNALVTLLDGVLAKPEMLGQWANRATALAHERAWPMTGQRFVGHFQRAMARAPRSRGTSHSGPASVWSQKESL
jgi:glycosyltransferase involved in cell wall biosynthesis